MAAVRGVLSLGQDEREVRVTTGAFLWVMSFIGWCSGMRDLRRLCGLRVSSHSSDSQSFSEPAAAGKPITVSSLRPALNGEVLNCF